MPDIRKIQRYLTMFDFQTLFVEELGWDYAREQDLPITVGNETYTLSPLVKKADVRVYQCPPDAQGRLLGDQTLRKIERELTKYVYEHILVAGDAAKENQVWLWIKRTREKTTTPRYLRWYQGQSGESVAKSLSQLAVELDEELQADTLHVLEKTRSAFDLEKVTKKFYDRFKQEHDAFLGFIDGITSQGDREWYASVMLNRLMFTYFLQEKGILGHKNTGQLDGDRRYLQNRLQMVQERYGEGTFYSFYRSFLLRLFHEGFCQRIHSPELIQLIGNVRYLNGGLFDVHALEQKYQDITIPDEAFRTLFAFFDAYRWTLDDRPLRSDREINPDVLGYIFEKYINQKQMGAYYTKEDITGYISKNTILPSLLETAKDRCEIAFKADGPVWSLLRENPDRYIYSAIRRGCEKLLPPEIEAGLFTIAQRTEWNKPAEKSYALPTEIWREVILRRQRYEEVKAKLAAGEITSINDLITYNLDILQFVQDAVAYSEGPDELEAFYTALEHMTILDPTCGSGAFLFAALNILESLYKLCLEGMQAMVNERDHLAATMSPRPVRNYPRIEQFRGILREMERHPNPEYFIYKSIIVNNLYGVDIMEEAVEICKLRLFLKLVSQVQKLDDLEPLPDIDFNIRAGNTLVGLATYEEAVRAISGKTISKGLRQGETAFQSQMLFDDTLDRIQQKAKEIERGFAHFRKLQTDYDVVLDPHDLTTMKKQLQSQLADLGGELDLYLAKEYGVDRNFVPQTEEYIAQVKSWQAEGYSSAVEKWQREPHLFERHLAEWKESHQPFHWFVEFYGIMENGGFDVIIGNPPYIEYNKVRDSYLVKNYQTEASGNLYNYVIERCSNLLNIKGDFGMIVPLSGFFTQRMETYQNHIYERYDSLHISYFSGDAHPSVMFNGVKYRLAIVIGNSSKSSLFKVKTSNYRRWYADERKDLFSTLSYEHTISSQGFLRYGKLDSDISKRVLMKLLAKKVLLGDLLQKSGPGYISYHRSPVFWIRAIDFEPFFHSATRNRSLDHLKDLYAAEQKIARAVGAVLNSTCFYYWFIVQGNCRDVTGTDITSFPLGDWSTSTIEELQRLFSLLMSDLQLHSKRRIYNYAASGRVEYDEFYPRHSKPIIDEIDRVLAKHYGFTDEELDFIINYDIKYRMGRDDSEEHEE